MLLLAASALIISALYFILASRRRRATLGQLMTGLVVADETDGAKLTWRAGLVRWLALTLAPAYLVLADWAYFLLLIGWSAVLLITTARSPAKQGLHDRWARSLVARRT